MERRYLIAALALLAAGAFLLHFRIHPPLMRDGSGVSIAGMVAFVVITLDILLVPYLLSFRSGAAYGFMLNGMIAILGTILMAHFSFSRMTGISIYDLIFHSTLPDILITFADFLLSKVIYDSHFPGR